MKNTELLAFAVDVWIESIQPKVNDLYHHVFMSMLMVIATFFAVLQMQSSIRIHKDNFGGVFRHYQILTIQRVCNHRLWERYTHRKEQIAEENSGQFNERLLFHGSPFIQVNKAEFYRESDWYQTGFSCFTLFLLF